MFAIMPSPAFSFGGTNHTASLYRPAAPSPLSSSSPTRPSSPPLSPRDPDASSPQRGTVSSPIRPPTPSSSSGPKFRFAARTPRPNPVVQKRADAREGRRQLFLSNVRERADERRWERRGGEQELLKLEWLRLNREFRQAQEERLAQFDAEEQIEEAAQLQEEMSGALKDNLADGDDDAMIDALAQEEAEMEALAASMMSDEPTLSSSPSVSDQYNPAIRPDSPHFSDDDDDYDSLFMDFAAQEDRLGNRQREDSTIVPCQDMDMS